MKWLYRRCFAAAPVADRTMRSAGNRRTDFRGEFAAMASPYTQEQRIGRLETPLGKDRLALISFEATEGLSRLFEYRIEALNKEKKLLSFDDAVGKHCTVKLRTVDGDERIFDGILA